MGKINRNWIIFSFILWLFACQALFTLIQRGIADKTVESIQNQLRQELSFSDFHFLARSITDYTSSGAIRCAALVKLSPENTPIIDLRYMENHCSRNPFLLSGSDVDVSLKSLNGDEYRFTFISNNSKFFYFALWGFRIFGLILIYSIFVTLSLRSEKEILNLRLELEFASRMNEVALQLSHDIRSPLAALRVAIEDGDGPIIKMAIGRIEEIANNLLIKKREGGEELNQEESIIQLLESIVIEKHTEFKNKKTKVQFLKDNIDSNISVKVNQQSFKRVISNLINNAHEAIPEDQMGEIRISVDLLDDDKLQVKIQDNGKGIPAKLIEKIGTKGFSHGKNDSPRSGSGLGLFHAKETMISFAGDLKIESQENVGTSIILQLPYEKTLTEISNVSNLSLKQVTILVDDDDLVKLTWGSKAKKAGVSLIAYSSSEELLSNLHLFSSESVFYIDSDLKNEKGEDLAKKLADNGFANVYLATGHPKENFSHLGFLKDVISKQPPF